MTIEKMNIHKALSELKVIDSRITKALSPNFITVKKHGSENIRGMSVKQVTDGMEDAYRKVNDLIARRNAIKRAVVLSNAVTKVTIAGKEYTVAEAIDMKNHGLDGVKDLHRVLLVQFKSCTDQAAHENSMLDTRADGYIKDMYGSTDMSKIGDDARKSREEFIKAQTVELVNPLDVLNEIERLEAEINAFEVEVDSALSVSNATTEIEIEY